MNLIPIFVVGSAWTMVVSWATRTCMPIPLPLRTAAVSTAPTSSCSTNLIRLNGPRRGLFSFYIVEKRPKVRTFVVVPNQVSVLQTYEGNWEDPDDGSGSEYGEEVEENDLDFESDWEVEKDAPAATTASVEKTSANKDEEDLVKGY